MRGVAKQRLLAFFLLFFYSLPWVETWQVELMESAKLRPDDIVVVPVVLAVVFIHHILLDLPVKKCDHRDGNEVGQIPVENDILADVVPRPVKRFGVANKDRVIPIVAGAGKGNIPWAQ